MATAGLVLLLACSLFALSLLQLPARAFLLSPASTATAGIGSSRPLRAAPDGGDDESSPFFFAEPVASNGTAAPAALGAAAAVGGIALSEGGGLTATWFHKRYYVLESCTG